MRVEHLSNHYDDLIEIDEAPAGDEDLDVDVEVEEEQPRRRSRGLDLVAAALVIASAAAATWRAPILWLIDLSAWAARASASASAASRALVNSARMRGTLSI